MKFKIDLNLSYSSLIFSDCCLLHLLIAGRPHTRVIDLLSVVTNTTCNARNAHTPSREQPAAEDLIITIMLLDKSSSSSYFILQHNIKEIRIITVEYKNMPEGCQRSKRSLNRCWYQKTRVFCYLIVKTG